MFSLITLDDHTGSAVTLHDVTGSSKRSAVTINGLMAGYIATPRDDKDTLPQAHGAINNTRFTDGAQPSLTLEVMGSSQSDCLAQYKAMIAPMIQTLDYGPALLKWTEADGAQYQRLVKLDSVSDPTIQGGAAVLTFQVSFFAEDPRAYSQTLTTTTTSAVTSLLANPNFASDTLNAAAAHWAVASGTFSTNKVINTTFGFKYLSLAASLTNGASASLISDKFAVTAGVEYAVTSLLDNLFGGGNTGVAISVLTYTSGGTLLTTTLLDTATQSGLLTTLTGRFVPGGTATQAAILITLSNNSGSTVTVSGDVFQVVCSTTPKVTVVNAGLRDTPIVVTLSGAQGRGSIELAGSLALAMTNVPLWATYSTGGSVAFDFKEETVIGTGFTQDLPDVTPLDGSPISLLVYLDPLSAEWAYPPIGSTDITATGLLLGSTLSVSYRSAY